MQHSAWHPAGAQYVLNKWNNPFFVLLSLSLQIYFTCWSISTQRLETLLSSTLQEASAQSRRLVAYVENNEHIESLDVKQSPDPSIISNVQAQSISWHWDGVLETIAFFFSEIASLSSGQVPEMASESQLFNNLPTDRSDCSSNSRTGMHSRGTVHSLSHRGLRQTAVEWIGQR